MSYSPIARKNYPYNMRYSNVLQYNPITDEPFIPLPAPYSNIRLTPARLDDTDAILPIMNNLEVCMNFANPPFPYLRQHSDAWLQDRVREYQNAMVHITNTNGDVGFLDTFPLRHIREVASDGAETFLGDIGLIRENKFIDIKEEEAQMARINSNIGLPSGNPNIVWTIGGEWSRVLSFIYYSTN